MFDDDTAQRIRASAPFPSRPADELPEELAAASARIAAARLRVRAAQASGDGIVPDPELAAALEMLRHLADAQEMLVAARPERADRAASAFVGATAHALLRQGERHLTPNDSASSTTLGPAAISSNIAAAVLFMVGESLSDAAQAGRAIEPDECAVPVRPLARALRSFACGEPRGVLAQTMERGPDDDPVHERAWVALYRGLLVGLQAFARGLLGESDLGEASNQALKRFRRVERLSGVHAPEATGDEMFGLVMPRAIGTFPGPRHLAALLIGAVSDLGEAAIIAVPPPSGVPPNAWVADLATVAPRRPFLWTNHRTAIAEGYLAPGCSAVVSFPTGAGKSLLAELKISTHRLRSRRVFVIAPTRALVEQTRRDLAFRFQNVVVDTVEEGAADETVTGEIVVATPEALLARMALEDDAFEGAGLLVFDECHLLHPNRSGWDRRAFDAMLCLTGFMARAPDADVLLISAMVQNGDELARWIEETTGRDCVALSIDLKPARQLRGAIVHDAQELAQVRRQVARQRAVQSSPNPGVAAQGLAAATPRALISLHLRWSAVERQRYALLDLLDGPFPLRLGGSWKLAPNYNELAAALAAAAAGAEIRTLVFALQVSWTKTVADKVIERLTPHPLTLSDDERRWFDNAVEELGDSSCSYLREDDAGRIDGRALVHHAKLLPAERRLTESLYRRPGGARVLCATSTLAQGMNLPSEFVILAGTGRYDGRYRRVVPIEAVDLLNAAGRAGRAGKAGNGFTLAIPAEIMSLEGDALPEDGSWPDLQDVFGDSDRCISVTDPFESLLDGLEIGLQDDEMDMALYALRRLAPFVGEEGRTTDVGEALRRSFAAFSARRRGERNWVEARVAEAVRFLTDADANEEVTAAADVAAEMGLSREAVSAVMDALGGRRSSRPEHHEGLGGMALRRSRAARRLGPEHRQAGRGDESLRQAGRRRGDRSWAPRAGHCRCCRTRSRRGWTESRSRISRHVSPERGNRTRCASERGTSS